VAHIRQNIWTARGLWGGCPETDQTPTHVRHPEIFPAENFPRILEQCAARPALVSGGGGGGGVARSAYTRSGNSLVRARNAFMEKGEGHVLDMCYHPKVRPVFFGVAERNWWKVISET
jgi:hypothetical protein